MMRSGRSDAGAGAVEQHSTSGHACAWQRGPALVSPVLPPMKSGETTAVRGMPDTSSRVRPATVSTRISVPPSVVRFVRLARSSAVRVPSITCDSCRRGGGDEGREVCVCL